MEKKLLFLINSKIFYMSLKYDFIIPDLQYLPSETDDQDYYVTILPSVIFAHTTLSGNCVERGRWGGGGGDSMF